jgi:hypothetical protein
MPNFLVENNFYQGTSQACITDLTPPTFAGINFLDVESRGQIRAGWSAATDPTAPIRYEVYIKANNNVNLFNTANIVAITDKLQYDIFTMPDGSFLQNGTVYFVGVRALDGVNNRDNNTVSQSVISTGVLTSIDVYESKANFSVDQNDNFRVIAWCDKNESLAIAPSAVMGPASYTVYDNVGNLVAGMTGTVASPNAAGLYVFSPVNSSLDLLNKHYQVRVSIQVDGENRVNFIEVPTVPRMYEVKGAADFNASGQLIGSFWVERNGELATTGLGLGSYEVYTQSGVLIPSLSEANITPDANGFYVATPITPSSPLDVTQAYVVRVTVEVDGQTQTTQFVLGNEPEVYDTKAVFSINASNQLEATFWVTKTNDLISGATLGTASYQVYDKNGNPVAGLSETGIVADSNGYFHTTPVNATLLTDLTHYTAKITIVVAGQARVGTKGFTLLGN